MDSGAIGERLSGRAFQMVEAKEAGGLTGLVGLYEGLWRVEGEREKRCQSVSSSS